MGRDPARRLTSRSGRSSASSRSGRAPGPVARSPRCCRATASPTVARSTASPRWRISETLASAWYRPVSPAPLYWTTSALVVALAIGLGVLAWRCWRSAATADRRSGPGEGFSSRQEVRRSAGAAALLARGATLRPSLGDPRPDELAYLLGHSRGVACCASVEESMLLLGPPRSDKGYNVVVPMLLDAPGAVVTTSTRPDNLAVCLEARAARGPVAVFDPQGLCHGAVAGPQRRWSLVRGCEDPQVAMFRALRSRSRSQARTSPTSDRAAAMEWASPSASSCRMGLLTTK